MKKKNSYIILILFSFVNYNKIIPQTNLTLPTYYITLSPQDFSKLYSNPSSNVYYPAQIKIDDIIYDCEIRFRGASARYLPKKSWKIKFSDKKNSFQSHIINFNAEYRDRSLMRNYLTNKLFEFMGEPAAKISFVNLFINSEYYGVFNQVEELEKDFLERNNMPAGSVYKARSHQANFAPLPKYLDYFYSWDKQVGNLNDYTDLIKIINQLRYLSTSEFENNIEEIVDIENILNYFAITFSVVGFDSFTKNYNPYINIEGKQLKLFPWDNDATFGNLWDGSFQNDYIYNIDGNKDQNWECLKFNVLFQRLMEFDNYRNIFNTKVNEIITNGFDSIVTVVENTYSLISNDVHKDKFKGYSNQQFDDEKIKLKYFLTKRKNFLMGKTLFNRVRVDEFKILNPFPQANQMSIVEVKLNQAADVFFDYVPNYDVKNGSTNFNVISIKLYDDGSMQDKVAGDLIYGNNFFLQDFAKGVIPFAIRINESYYPANGFSYFGYGPTVTFALSSINGGIDIENSLLIKSVTQYNDDQIVLIENIGEQEIDLTYFNLKGKNLYDNFVFPPGSKLKTNSEIAITTNKKLANYLYPNALNIEYLNFYCSSGDTLKIYSPANTYVTQKLIDTITIPQILFDKIVINEINYHSSDSLDTGDWIEFYNPNEYTIFLEDYKFKDEKDDHVYTFPKSATIASNGYFVLCQDVKLFKSIHPNVQAMGNFNFGLSNSGEKIRLFNNNNIIISQVNYSDDYPWDSQADGEGYSLELKNPEFETDNPESWAASKVLGGSPGKQNTNFITSVGNEENEILKQFMLFQNFPNPFNPTTTIEYIVPAQNKNFSTVKVFVYDILGKKIKTIVNEEKLPGKYSVTFEAENLASGVYYYSLKAGDYFETKKMLLIR